MTIHPIFAAADFFATHAGFSYGSEQTPEQGRTECSRALATAERRARALGMTFEWADDPEGDVNGEGPAFACTAWIDGVPVASLGGITFGDAGFTYGDPYRRVVEADLALEGLTSA